MPSASWQPFLARQQQSWTLPIELHTLRNSRALLHVRGCIAHVQRQDVAVGTEHSSGYTCHCSVCSSELHAPRATGARQQIIAMVQQMIACCAAIHPFSGLLVRTAGGVGGDDCAALHVSTTSVSTTCQRRHEALVIMVPQAWGSKFSVCDILMPYKKERTS